MSFGIGLFWALCFALPAAVLAVLRKEDKVVAFTATFVANLVILFLVDAFAFHLARPAMTFSGLMPLAWWNLFVVFIVSAVVSGRMRLAKKKIGFGWVIPLVCLVVAGIICIVGYNSDHNAYAASHIVSVVTEPNDALPASSTSNMVIVPPDVATTKANQTMATGIAGQRNYSTYLNLGPATLQMVDGHMWYVFPLEFDGSGNKARLHAVMPGYIMISAEDPNATPIERYDGQYTMIVGLGAGQGAEPDRWVYDHGYNNGILNDPTLEIDENGNPWYTVTMLQPHLGWTFYAPSYVLLINAHTGQIYKYGLGDVPSWVDRVYSSSVAETIANWYGQYSQAGFQGIGSSNANRFQVSGDPVLTYTGSGNPSWRMLLTSYNSDSAVYRIIEMDAHTGTMHIYTPQQAMGTEDTVNEAFGNASGIGASLIRANHWVPTDLTLHVIYGLLTWMVSYETDGSNPSFVGLGFVDAYHATANNVVFGNDKATALQNYLTQLASQGSANGNAPGQGGLTQTITGTIAPAPHGVQWDVTDGQKYIYLELSGDPKHVYVGTASAVGPALLEATPGDHVTITVLNVGLQESERTMRSFTDANVPLQPAGS
jgi:hypothetical protein